MGAELLAKLTTKSIRLTHEASGGNPVITWGDVAASLAGTSKMGYLLVLAKYTDDRKASSSFLAELAKEIKKERNCSIGIALRVAVACSFPVISPLRCHKCKGRGVIYSKNKEATNNKCCPACEGGGYRKISDRKRAEIANIPSSTWHDSWRLYCNDKENQLCMLEDITIRHFNKNIKGIA